MPEKVNGKFVSWTLYVDQYGNKFYANTLKELREQVSGRCSRMFIDTKGGKVFHVGYVIGGHWLTGYAQTMKEVTR